MSLPQHRPHLFFSLLTSLFFILTCHAADNEAVLSLDIRGVSEPLTDNIVLHIGILHTGDLDRPRLLERRLREAIDGACQALGYYQCEFHYQVEQQKLQIHITAGGEIVWQLPAFDISAEALSVEAIAQLVEKHPFQPGERIRHSDYDRFKRQLLETAQEYGFLDAYYGDSRLLIDRSRGQATAHLTLVSGPRYRLDRLQFTGTRLNSGLLQRLSPLQHGDYIRRSEISLLQRNLQNTRYFSDIALDTDNDTDSASTDINAELADAPGHQFGVGLGYGTDTGPRTRLRWTQPHVTRGGHSWVSEARLSSPIREISSHYHIPLKNPLDHSFNLSVDWTEKHVEDTTSQLSQVGAGIERRLSNTWFINYGANFEWESFRQGSQPEERIAYLLPEFSLLRTSIPITADPMRGSKTALTATGSSHSLGADIGFARMTLLHRQLLSLGGSRLLTLRAEVGAIRTDDLLRVPASKRFFTGGDQTVRGFRYESIATEDSAGELIGGKHLNVVSAEYSARFATSWRAAIFTDAGRAFSDKDERWRRSAGVGVRWLSPVGQVSLDIAAPIDDDEQHGPRLHLVMGAAL